ncbi:hypothetical protein LUZ63_002624 [Rhynchospora breviuscula]|uniref:Survival Motor Neuron Gemin2-binding domain-containing protein n=1 Tax=Rhynchospora breviuscula TaxID=2022672 RepID=A0A9Q0CZN0_9POAL|nr:hypothetical protein LUZ63_002624 [Rhynchospora breviuscula]
MGKGQELWDDSALVDAFDRAVASFKEAQSQAGVSAEEDKEITHLVEDVYEYTNFNSSDGLTYPNEKAARKEEIHDEEPVKGNDVNSYDELLKQYYELEEKRQAVLRQLYTHPSYYNQTVEPDAYNPTPEPSAQNPQTLNPVCVGYCLPVPVEPLTGGNSCGPWKSCSSACQTCDKCPVKCASYTPAMECSTSLTKQSSNVDHSMDFKKGMLAAESAMRVINANISGKESETVGINECLQGIGTSDADLVPVLNAWYSAGFHTARYLLGKSQQNNP